MIRQYLALVVLTCACCCAHADGKMYSHEQVPPTIPYQRAMIYFGNGVETMILQSKAAGRASAGASLGWVVPVPAVPKVTSMTPQFATFVFRYLSRHPAPVERRASELARQASWVVLALLSVLAVAAAAGWARLRRCGKWLPCAIALTAWAAVALMPGPRYRSEATRSDGVTVLSEQTAGVYDVKVVASDDAGNLIGWLNASRFRFGQSDTKAFDRYIARKWRFVVATLRPERQTAGSAGPWEGLAAPLVLEFPAIEAVYPTGLTATGGFDTEVLLYVLSDHKVVCGGRITPRSCATMERAMLGSLLDGPPGGSGPNGSLRPRTPLVVSKFRDTLTSRQMTDDIVFTRAPDDAPFRETVWVW